MVGKNYSSKLGGCFTKKKSVYIIAPAVEMRDGLIRSSVRFDKEMMNKKRTDNKLI